MRDLKRLACLGYLVLLLGAASAAVVVLPLVEEAVRRPGGGSRLLLAYLAANLYILLAFVARECLTRRQALPGGAGRVDFLRAVDLGPEAVCVAYLAVSVVPALGLVLVLDVLAVAYLAPAAGLGAVAVLSLVLAPVAGSVLAVAVVAGNAVAGPSERSRRPCRGAVSTVLIGVVAGAGLGLLGQLLMVGGSATPSLPADIAWLPPVLLASEVLAAGAGLRLVAKARRSLRSDPYPLARASGRAPVPVGLPGRRVEQALPAVLATHLAGTPYGRLVGRLVASVALLLGLTTGAWLVFREALLDGPVAESAGKALVYMAFMTAIAVSELVLLGAGPGVLRPQLRSLWESGAGAWSLARSALAAYVLVPSTVLAALAVAGSLSLAADPWALLLLGPAVSAAGLIGQALGRSDEPDLPVAAPSDVSALSAVVTLLVSVPALYLALQRSGLALLGELCYTAVLMAVAAGMIRRGILQRSAGAAQPWNSTA